MTTQLDRNRKPLQSGCSLNAVSVLPRLFYELNIVENDKQIHLIDQIKISHPWQVRRLAYRNLHSGNSCSASEGRRLSDIPPNIAVITRSAPCPSTSLRHLSESA